jgi:GNAT superfamily N-acetyltransferase
MVRKDLERVPEFALPARFSLRWYRPGDEAHWRRIHWLADRDNEITPALFGQRFGSDSALLARRQCYLLDAGGEAIGTATAWFNDNFEGARFGRVHYVAIVPEYQGRGLSRPLMTAICQRLRELGHYRAYLTTAPTRLPAIKLYLRFGFLPLVRSAEEAAAWRGICPQQPEATAGLPPFGKAQDF